MHTAEPLVPEPSPSKFEITRANLKSYKLIKFRQNWLEHFLRFIKLINFIQNAEELSEQRKESTIVLVYKKGDKTDCSNYRGIIIIISFIQNIIQNPSLKD
jgi:hypothetical protein